MELVFLQNLKAESANYRDRAVHTSAVFYDMSSYYDHVCLKVLRTRAQATGFNMMCLTVACNMYRSQRFFTMNGYALASLFPDRSILAGCPWATFLVQVYSYVPVKTFVENHRLSDLYIFIDDWMNMNMDADRRALVNRTVASSSEVIRLIEEDLGCQLASKKSAVVAKSDSLRCDLEKAMGKFAGTSNGRSAKNLGIDATAGQLRCRKGARLHLTARVKNLHARKRRLAAVKKGGGDMQRLYISGLQSYGYYGAEVVGLDGKEVVSAQSFFLQTVGSTCPSRSRTLTLLLHEDPTYKLALGPALTWANLVWKATTSRDFEPSLPGLRELAEPVLHQGLRTWNQVKGPLGAAVLSLGRVSWYFKTTFVWVNHLGDEIHLPPPPPPNCLT